MNQFYITIEFITKCIFTKRKRYELWLEILDITKILVVTFSEPSRIHFSNWTNAYQDHQYRGKEVKVPRSSILELFALRVTQHRYGGNINSIYNNLIYIIFYDV